MAFLDSWLGYRAGQLDLPGFAVSIYYRKSVVFSRAYGMADIQRREPLSTGHVFAMASQSKMFTAAAILQLFGQGKLQLDDTVCSYVPWLAGHRDRRFRDITIRHLLSHGAGLVRDGRSTDFMGSKAAPFPGDEVLREAILGDGLVFEPNTRLKYSNLSFALLGQVVGAVSGEPHADYVNRHIIAALKLKDMSADFVPALQQRLPTGYGVPFDRERPVLAPPRPTAALAPAMGVHATTEAMCHFAAAQFFGDERLLPDVLKREMQRAAWHVNSGYDSGTEAGLGLEIHQIGNRRVVGHTGHLAGHVSATFFDPYDRLAVCVAGNCKDLPVMLMVRGVFEALDWFTAEPPAPARLARYQVRACGPTAVVDIVAAGHRLSVVDPDDWEPFTWGEELEIVAPGTLRIVTPGSIQSEGELIQVTFDSGTDVVKTVRYGGVLLVPESVYRQKISPKRVYK